MSNLDNLISKILKESEDKAGQIIETANARADEIMRENISIAEKEKEKILSTARTEAEKAAEQIILGKKLEIRDSNLNAKQAIVDKVFDVALQKLNNMQKDEYWKFLCNNLCAMDLDGEEIILPAKYGVTNIDELNAFLKANNKKGNLKLYNGDRKIDGGFVLLKGGIENNNTFETLIRYYRYELEGDVIASLF